MSYSLLKTILAFVVSTAGSVSFANSLGRDDMDGLASAISKNDANRVQELLNKSKTPFGPLGFFQHDEGGSHSGNELLGIAAGANHDDAGNIVKFCNKEIVLMLIDKGAEVQPQYLEGATKIPCPDLIETLSGKLSDDQVAPIATKLFTFINQRYGHMPSDEQEQQADKIKSYALAGKPLAERAVAKCPDKKGSSKFCETRMAMEALGAAVNQQEATEKHANSSEGLNEQACDLQAQIQEHRARIKKEQDVGRVSGFVNTEILHDHGAAVVTLTTQLNEIKEQYKAATKKKLTPKCE